VVEGVSGRDLTNMAPCGLLGDSIKNILVQGCCVWVLVGFTSASFRAYAI